MFHTDQLGQTSNPSEDARRVAAATKPSELSGWLNNGRSFGYSPEQSMIFILKASYRPSHRVTIPVRVEESGLVGILG